MSTVTRRGKIFEFADYPDRSFALTPEEWAAANADLKSVPLDLEHKPTILDGHLGHAHGFEVRGNSLFGAVEIPDWLHRVTKGVPLKVSAAWDRATKRLLKLSLVLRPRIPDAAVFQAAFAAGAIPEVPAEFATPRTRLSLGTLYRRWRAAGRSRVFNPHITMSDPIQTTSGQSKIQKIHDIAASHPGICPAKGGSSGDDSTDFGDRTNEHKTIRDLHDRSVAGGADCNTAAMSNPPPEKKPMKANFLEMFRFWKKAGEPEDFDLDMAEFAVPNPPAAPPAPASPPAPVWTDTPEYKAMAAEIKAVKDRAEADRLAQINKDAVAFAADLVRAGKLRPCDSTNVAAAYRTAALDDAAHPTEVTFSVDGKDVKGGRLDQLKATWAAMPVVMSLGRELVDPRADLAGFTVLPPDRQPPDPNKPPDAARADYLLSLSPAGSAILAARKSA